MTTLAEPQLPFDRPNVLEVVPLDPHVAFGHGAHFCIGASLARTELTAVFTRLFDRNPGLRLAIWPDELDVCTEHITVGVRAVPVTW